MTNTPRLLDQLVSLTALQDLELLEFSLLKTLQGFLLPLAVGMVRTDIRSRPVMEIVYWGGRCTIRRENLSLSEDLGETIRLMAEADTPEVMAPCPQGVQYVIGLLKTRSGFSYLLLTLDEELSKIDRHMIAGVLQIYRNFCSLLQSAQTDRLTGLANRKTFDECVAKVHELIPLPLDSVSNDRRQNTSPHYWLVMIDIDHFKLVNDRFGHLYGDEVLVLLSQLLMSEFREDDMIFRFGGEEFVVIIRCPDKETCRKILERFRLKVASTRFAQVGQVTISMGVMEMTGDTFTGTLIDYADQALYHSKNNGRNQTTFFEDMVNVGLGHVENVTPGGIDFF